MAASPVDDYRELLWKRVTERWDDPATHGAFLEFCQREGLLSDAAARYRGMAGDHERSAEAQRRLQAVVFLATQALVATRTPPQHRVPRGFILATVAVCTLGVGYTLLRLLGLG